MCESSIIRREGRKEVVLAEDIDFIRVLSKEKLQIRTILGEEKYIEGEIEEIDLHRHRVILREKKSNT